MKKISFLLILVAAIITSCQSKTKIVPVDLNASKVAVTEVLDKYNSAFKTMNIDAVMSLLTDDGLYCGTDSKELLTKTDLLNMMKQTLADTSVIVNYSIDKQEIRVTQDGNSAVALEQFIMKSFSPKMPIRMIYHLVKNNDTWLFDFVSWNFIPNNEDIGKLNKALE